MTNGIRGILDYSGAISVILIFLMTYMFYMARTEHNKFVSKITSIETKVTEIEKSVTSLRAVITPSCSDRWSKSMMKNYNLRMIEFIKYPDIEEIKSTTPIL